MTIGERIKIRRKELGLTQEELAMRLGNKSRASVCTVEKDKEDLTTTRIRQYAEALETTPAYLMGWDTAIDELQNQIKPVTDFLDTHEIRPEYKELFEKYSAKEIKRAIKFIEAFMSASPERQKIALEILQQSHQDGS